MTHEKDGYDMDKIPDYAMQPAREDIDTFDPAAYEKLFSELEPLKQEEAEPASQEEAPQQADSNGTAGTVEDEPAIDVGTGMETEIRTDSEIAVEMASGTEDAADIWNAAATVGEEEAEEVFEPTPPGGRDDTALSEEPVLPAQSEEPVSPVEAEIPPTGTPAVPVTAPAKIIPAGNAVISTNLKLTDIRPKPKLRLMIEEDILVPDVKPDLASVLSMEARVKLSEREISAGASGMDAVKLTGDLMVSTLYLPDRAGEDGRIIAIESRIPFKEEADVKVEPYSDLALSATVESIDFTVINERKFKVRAAAVVELKEYRALNLELFEGLRDEEVQMLSETIHMTDVALRKSESLEISEQLPLKDGSAPAGKILCYDVNVVENHKQITGEKAVINGTAYVNAMYLPEEEAAAEFEDGAERTPAEPVMFQGKAEFTQFMKLEDDGPAERPAQNAVGSKVNFRVNKAELVPSYSEEENASGFTLNLDMETTLEIYKDVETEVVTDVYHHMKEMRYDTREVSVMNLCGSGMAEISAREILNVPEKHGAADRIVFLTGRISDVRASLDGGKSVTEGVVRLSMICVAAGEEETPFSLQKEIPFRSAIDIPGIRGDMEVDSEAVLKELWYDKINNRQIEVNAGILVNTTVCRREKHPLINNVSFVEMPESAENEPGIILYITREGDNVWRIAKKYRTTIENIKKINGIDDSGKLKAGTKLLIVK